MNSSQNIILESKSIEEIDTGCNCNSETSKQCSCLYFENNNNINNTNNNNNNNNSSEIKPTCICIERSRRLPYDKNGLLKDINDPISEYPLFECIPGKCHLKDDAQAFCNNTVLQQGIQYPLYIFPTQNKGWGVACRTDIERGAFISEYTGCIRFTKKEPLDSSSDAKLDPSSSASVNYPPAAKKRRTQGTSKRTFQKLKENSNGNYTLILNELFGSETNRIHWQTEIDATHFGNIGRFINHSCDPNIFPRAIRVTHLLPPRVGFFASRRIKAHQEICFDYGSAYGLSESLPCHCGAANCRKWLPFCSNV